MNWRFIKPFTFSLLFISQSRRHGRIPNILDFLCIRDKPLLHNVKYWYKLCIKWLATTRSPFSRSSPVAADSLRKVPKTFRSGFCICYWVDTHLAAPCSQSKGNLRIPVHTSLLRRTPGWWLVAVLPRTRAGVFYWETRTWSQWFYCGFVNYGPKAVSLHGCQRMAATENSLGMGIPTCMSRWGFFVCLANLPALLLYSLGLLHEYCCFLNMVVFWVDLNNFLELLGCLWVRLVFCSFFQFSCSFGAVMGNYGSCVDANLNFSNS